MNTTDPGADPGADPAADPFEPPERHRLALLSPEFLLGIIVGATAIFIGFGIFGVRSGGSSTTVVSSPTARATLSAVTTPRPASPTPSPTPAPTPTPTPTATPTPSPSPTPSPTFAESASPSGAGPAGPLAGTWRATSGSTAGYRVTVHVVFVGPTPVHGTTNQVTGQFQISDTGGTVAITAGDFSADLRSLQSGNTILDRQVAQVLQIAQFPTSEFHLTQPVTIPDAASTTGIPITLHGNLTLQGIARATDLPATFTRTANGFTVVGAVNFLLSQYGVSNVVGGGLATVDDAANFDYSLILIR